MDIAKAFDSVDWYGLDLTMVAMGFDQTFINWVMECVTTASYSVLVNGSPSRVFHGSRGLRQASLSLSLHFSNGALDTKSE